MIKLDNIRKTYEMGDELIHALDGVSLHVKEHEFVAICGPSGSGKTTLMNIMGCLDTPDSGTYLLDGIDVSESSDKKLSSIRSIEIGFIFQQFNLLENMTAIENVELPLIYQRIGAKQRHDRALESLERVGLGNRKAHHPAQLSGGQQQRVAIARALASHSKVILADEPTGNLDTRSGEDVMRLICELSDKGSTIVLITHNERVAKRAQRTLYVKDGKLYDTAAEAGL